MGVLDLIYDGKYIDDVVYDSPTFTPRHMQAARFVYQVIRVTVSVAGRVFVPVAAFSATSSLVSTPHPGYGIPRIGGGIHSPVLGVFMIGPVLISGSMALRSRFGSDPNLSSV